MEDFMNTQHDRFMYSLEQLAEQVLAGHLLLEQALERVAQPPIISQENNTTIYKRDKAIQELPRQEFERAWVLAMLNSKVAQSLPDDIVWGNCNSTLGWAYLQREEPWSARYHYEEALNVFEPFKETETGVKATMARIQNELGQTWEMQAELEPAQRPANLAKASTAYQAALGLAEEAARLDYQSDALNGQGRVYLAQEQADKALKAFEQARQLSQSAGDQRGEGAALGNLGQASHFLGRRWEAVRYYQAALQFGRAAGHELGVGRYLSGLGSALLQLGLLDETEDRPSVETCFVEALGIARRLGDRRGEQQRWGGLGNLYQVRAEREQAAARRIIWLERAYAMHAAALASAKERGDFRGEGEQLVNLGRIFTALKQFDDAAHAYAQASAKLEGMAIPDTQWRLA